MHYFSSGELVIQSSYTFSFRAWRCYYIMRQFLCKLSVVVVYIISVQVVLPVVVDPSNVFHAEHIRRLPTEPNKNYIKMKYILANPYKFEGYMFGSSRVGTIHVEKIPGRKIYNMTYAGGLPVEHLNNLKTMISNDIKPSIIYIGVDGVSITDRAAQHLSVPYACPYEILSSDFEHFCSLMLNPYYVLRALPTILMVKESINKHTDPDAFYAHGWWADYDTKPHYDWSKSVYKPSRRIADLRPIRQTLKDIQYMYELCRTHNIEIILFANPMYCVTHMQAVDAGYLEFLEGLAGISEFYNFSGINDITNDRNNYLDYSHYTAQTGDLLINIMCNGAEYPQLQAQGFGVKVTRNNVKDFITLLKTQAEEFRHENSPAH